MKFLKPLVYWSACALEAFLNMILMGLAHGIDHRVPAFGFVVMLILNVVLMAPIFLHDVQQALEKLQ